MRRPFLPAFALTLASAFAGAQSTTTAEAPPAEPEKVGWFKQASSLLLYDEAGELATEIGLGHWEETAGARVNVLDLRGGASPNRRFAWTLERRTAWNLSRAKKLESKRAFKLLGSSGKELWDSSQVDVPEVGEPVSFSANGETLLLSLYTEGTASAFAWFSTKHSTASPRGSWNVAVKSYIGTTLMKLGPFPDLYAVEMAPNGKYALVRWSDPEKSATHTFIALETKTRRDVPSIDFSLGAARITGDGRIFAGKRQLFDFSASTPAATPPSAP